MNRGSVRLSDMGVYRGERKYIFSAVFVLKIFENILEYQTFRMVAQMSAAFLFFAALCFESLRCSDDIRYCFCF